MKNILYTIAITLIYSCTSAQTIVDMAGNRQNMHYENGQYYIKDINNYMQPYVGTWQYINGNNEFRITLIKIEMYHETGHGDNYYIDGFKIQYQKFENGQLIFTSPLNNYPKGIIKEFGKLIISFTDYERTITNEVMNYTNNASFNAYLNLIDLGNNQYSLKFDLYKEHLGFGLKYNISSNDPYFSVPNNIVMTKL